MNTFFHRKYFDCWLLLAGVIAGVAVHWQTEKEFDMITLYCPYWVSAVSFFGPALVLVYFVWRYRLSSRKDLFTLAIATTVSAFVGLTDVLPRLVLLATVPEGSGHAIIEELDVQYVSRHYAKTTYVGSNVGIRYGGELLRFRSSRTNYFLLAGKRCIRAEIGQAVPGFYFVRNLQFHPDEQALARAAYWQDWWSRVGRGITFITGIGAIILAGWLLTRIPGMKNRLRKVNW